MSNEEKLVSHYRLKTLLRRDGFGAVYLAEDTRDQKDLILRVIDLDQKTLAAITGRVRARSQRDHPLIEQIRQRMKRISELKHSHILLVNEFGEEHIQGNNDIIFYMASPLEKESLLSYWSEHTSRAELISLEIVADFLIQAAEALHAVHRRGLVHQYVRLSSFMLRSSTRGRKHLHLLLTDFWFADISTAILEEGQMAQALSVYLAPEQLSTGVAVAASDQYALAVLAYELLLGYRLSQVNLDLLLYEGFVRQRAAGEISESDLILARSIDLVLARALSENPAARFRTIEEFALAFRAVSRGESSELLLTDETVKVPIQRKKTAGIVEATAGAVVAGEMLADLAATEASIPTSDESTAAMVATAQSEQETQRTHPRGLHKTTLTSEGMAALELEQSATSLETGSLASETSATALVTEETTGGATGFMAGLAIGEALGEAEAHAQETQAASAQSHDIAEENTFIMEGGAAGLAAGLAAGAMLASEAQSGGTSQAGGTSSASSDIAEENTFIMESGAASLAAGLAAGAILASEAPTGTVTQGGGIGSQQGGGGAEESTEAMSGGALGVGAAGLAAGAILASEAPTGTITQSGATGSQQGGGGAEESTLAMGGAALAAGAAGLAAGAILAHENQTGSISQAGTIGARQTSGAEFEETQIGTSAATLAAAGLAGATLVAGAGATQQASSSVLATTGGMAQRRRRPLLVASLITLVLLVVFGSVAFAMFAFASQSSATVVLTPQSHNIQTSYLLTAVTSTASLTQGQVQARTLSSTISQSKSGQASGFFAGVRASGLITFRNTSTGCGCPVIIPAGTAFTSTNGVTIVIDTAASVASLCSVTVRAHAINFGPGGNIGVGAVNTTFSPTMFVTNPIAFSGGKAGQSRSVVQQSDIDKLSSTLLSQVTQSAQAGISSQLHSNEHLLNAPACQTQTSADHPAGTVATTVNVTVSTTCTAEAYDYAEAVQWTQQQVQTQATTYFSDKFALVGGMQTHVKSATLVDAQTGKILLEIGVTGTWSYQFSTSQKQSMATFIPGKDVNEVRTFFANIEGVKAVSIAISGMDQSKLPSDASKITIVVKN